MKIKKNDTVIIISGKDKNKKGKIIRVLPTENRVVVEGANLRKKHRKARREGEKGQVVEIAAPINVSSVKLMCPKCKMPARIGYKLIKGDKKYRVCKKCQQEI